MKKIIALTLSLLLVISLSSLLTSCKDTNTAVESKPDDVTEKPVDKDVATEDPIIDKETTDPNNEEELTLPDPIVTIEMENGGIIKIKLLPKYAPNTVNNFVTLAQSGYYDGLNFHRVVPGFMIQGGDPDGTGGGGPGYGIAGEFINNGFNDNLISHERGVISMARSAAPDSAGSQFFIVVGDAKFLDKEYAGFGAVVEGMDVVDALVNLPTIPANESNPEGSTPVDPPVIKTVTVDTQGVENWPAPVTV